MVVYRSTPPVPHGCTPGNCGLCSPTGSHPPPANPEQYEVCCSYTSGGLRYTVVFCDIPAGLVGKPKRPGARGAQTKRIKQVDLAPQARGKQAAEKRAKPKRKAPAVRRKPR